MKRGCRLTIEHDGRRSVIECISAEAARKLASYWLRVNGHKSARGLTIKFTPIAKKGRK